MKTKVARQAGRTQALTVIVVLLIEYGVDRASSVSIRRTACLTLNPECAGEENVQNGATRSFHLQFDAD
jgi:hypothetical protein